MTAPMSREQTLTALRVMVRRLNAAVESNEWTLETARLLNLAQDIGAWLDSRTPTHRPMRGSDVETWIKRRRNQWAVKGSAPWYAMDALLDDYRERADTGTALTRSEGV